jgi:hypothetical protein
MRISVCHCLACKRRTGSAFSFNARFAEERVSLQGQAIEYTRTSHVPLHFSGPVSGAMVDYQRLLRARRYAYGLFRLACCC